MKLLVETVTTWSRQLGVHDNHRQVRVRTTRLGQRQEDEEFRLRHNGAQLLFERLAAQGPRHQSEAAFNAVKLLETSHNRHRRLLRSAHGLLVTVCCDARRRCCMSCAMSAVCGGSANADTARLPAIFAPQECAGVTVTSTSARFRLVAVIEAPLKTAPKLSLPNSLMLLRHSRTPRQPSSHRAQSRCLHACLTPLLTDSCRPTGEPHGCSKCLT